MNPEIENSIYNFLQNQITDTPLSLNNELFNMGKKFNHRDEFNEITPFIDEFLEGNNVNRYIVLPGLRGVGKTTILFQVYDYLLNQKNINPEEVVQKFVNVFDDIVGGLKWIIKNKDAVVRAMEGVVVGWAGLKLTGGALQILQLVNGVKQFQGVPTAPPSNVTGGNGDVIATGAGAGAGATGGFWSNLLNKMTLFGLAGAMYEGTEGRLRKMRDDFEKATEGMTPEERNRYIMKTEFHMTDEQYNKM
jgi:hypothetical protein